MEMFLGHQVRKSDTRLKAIYANYEKNLRDLIAVARSAVARAFLDCPRAR